MSMSGCCKLFLLKFISILKFTYVGFKWLFIIFQTENPQYVADVSHSWVLAASFTPAAFLVKPSCSFYGASASFSK